MITSVGVVVPAHNEEGLMPSCLAALTEAARAVRGLPVHVVVVADACQDRTAAVAGRSGTVVIEVNARSVGIARAAGFHEVLRRTSRLVPGEVWLATTDADTVVPPDWLERQVGYADAGWDAVVGTVEVANWFGRHRDLAVMFAERYGAADAPQPHVHGANLGFRASSYLAAGGFPGLPTAEDRAFVAALAASGSRILRTRALAVVTSGRRLGRAPQGFAAYLRNLEAEAAGEVGHVA
jgi:glycosyltransferase involved in cell wall biosynthesis